MQKLICKHERVSYVSFAGFLWQLLLTNITLESKLLWDFVQTNQRCVSNFPKDVGEDARCFGAVIDRRENTPKMINISCLSVHYIVTFT